MYCKMYTGSIHHYPLATPYRDIITIQLHVPTDQLVVVSCINILKSVI